MTEGADLDTMRGFVAVARRLSFRVAAQELAMDATVLSRKIARLETRLGVRLLQRTTRKVMLTEAGAAYLQRCDDLLARLADAEAEVSRYAAGPTGRLRLAVPNLFGQRHIAPLMPAFMALHPGLRIELAFSDRMVDLLDHQLDTTVRIGASEATADLRVRRLATLRRVVCASPAYLERHGEPQQPADLATHRTLHFTPLLGGNSWRLRREGRAVDVAVDPVLRADNAEALRLAALAGTGIAVLADFVIGDDLAAGRLRAVLVDWQLPEAAVYLAYPNAPFTPLKVRAFSDFLAERFARSDLLTTARR